MRLKSLLLATTIVTILYPVHQASAAVHKSTKATTPAKGTVKTTGKKTAVRQAAVTPRRSHAVDSNSNEQMIVTGTHAFNRRARDSTSP
ncbi:hypothetical protein AD936_04830, partial [Gluconobacter japonicus]